MDRISIVILTFNRPELLKCLLTSLSMFSYKDIEIIVVDNGSPPYFEMQASGQTPKVRYIRNEENRGIEGRNIGLRNANGQYVVTLDDDVRGIDDNSLRVMLRIFDDDPSVGAICFKVIDGEKGGPTNWCHHYKVEEYANRYFATNEISEGAVVFRKSAIEKAGCYPGYFFISHEGADLACRLINMGYNIVYCPEIVVRHYHAGRGRAGWRRYYYDTRNQIWFAIRNYPIAMGAKYLIRGLGSMFIYCVRDGYVRYFVKAIYDGLRKSREVWKERNVIEKKAQRIIKEIEGNRPGVVYMASRRMMRRGIGI